MSPPTHQECEGVLGMRVDRGHFGSVSLDGVKWAVAYPWLGAIHLGHGTVRPSFDPSTTREQLDALAQILTGRAGGAWFEVLATVVSQVKPPAVVPIDFQVSGKTGAIKIGDGIRRAPSTRQSSVREWDRRDPLELGDQLAGLEADQGLATA